MLAAATYDNEIPDAARWTDQHHYLTGQALANAIQADQLRVSSPSKDDLQDAMRLLRDHDFGVALQFGNYR